jgi:hypothetical protein
MDHRTPLSSAAVEARRPTRRCPTCGAAVGWRGNPHRPFCSERCRLVDLGNWADDRYRVKGESIGDDDEEGNGASG